MQRRKSGLTNLGTFLMRVQAVRQATPGVIPSVAIFLHWNVTFTIVLNRKSDNNNMDDDFAYLLGASGDATLTYRKRKGEYCIEFEQKNRQWLQKSIVPRIAKLYGKRLRVRRRKSGLYRVRLYSKAAYLQFRQCLGSIGQMLFQKRGAQVNYVRGFFDAEGSAPRRAESTQYRLQFYQKDRKPLVIISKILLKCGISAGKMTNSRHIGQLPVRGRQNAQKFFSVVGAEHPQKLRALRKLCS